MNKKNILLIIFTCATYSLSGQNNVWTVASGNPFATPPSIFSSNCPDGSIYIEAPSKKDSTKKLGYCAKQTAEECSTKAQWPQKPNKNTKICHKGLYHTYVKK